MGGFQRPIWCAIATTAGNAQKVLGHRTSMKHALLDGPWTSISAAWHQLIMRALAWAGSHLALSAQSRNRFGVCVVASHGQLAIGELLAGLFDVKAVRSVPRQASKCA